MPHILKRGLLLPVGGCAYRIIENLLSQPAGTVSCPEACVLSCVFMQIKYDKRWAFCTNPNRLCLRLISGYLSVCIAHAKVSAQSIWRSRLSKN